VPSDDTHILLCLKGADWGMVDVEDGSVPKKFPISSNEDEEVSEDDNPVSAKVNDLL
jgi:hypothetical protein